MPYQECWDSNSNITSRFSFFFLTSKALLLTLFPKFHAYCGVCHSLNVRRMTIFPMFGTMFLIFSSLNDAKISHSFWFVLPQLLFWFIANPVLYNIYYIDYTVLSYKAFWKKIMGTHVANFDPGFPKCYATAYFCSVHSPEEAYSSRNKNSDIDGSINNRNRNGASN